MNIRNIICIAVLSIGTALSAVAQQGHFLNPWVQPQVVSIYNFHDNRSDWYPSLELKQETRITYAAGVDYFYNYSPHFGWHSGITYSRQGDAYSGRFRPDSIQPIDWESEVTLDYIQVPILFRFSSGFDEKERVNMSISAGFEFGYLIAASASTQPAGVDYSAYNLKEFYKKVDVAFSTQAALNIFFTKNVGMNFGARLSRSVGNIENHSYNYDNTVPHELYFPISTMKEDRPEPTRRLPSKNVVTGAFLGLVFKVGDVSN